MTQVLHIHSWTTSGISKNSQYCDSEAGYWCSKCTVFLSKNHCPRKPLSHLSAEPMPCGPQEEHHGGAGGAAFPRLGDEARTSPRSAPQQVLPRRSQNVQARVSTSQAPRSFLRVRVSPPPHPTKVLLSGTVGRRWLSPVETQGRTCWMGSLTGWRGQDVGQCPLPDSTQDATGGPEDALWNVCHWQGR